MKESKDNIIPSSPSNYNIVGSDEVVRKEEDIMFPFVMTLSKVYEKGLRASLFVSKFEGICMLVSTRVCKVVEIFVIQCCNKNCILRHSTFYSF